MSNSLKEVVTSLKPDKSSLLPCPFCGGEALVQPTYDLDTGERDGYFAWCSNYDCECKPQTRDYITEAEAIAAWNTRAERTCKCGWRGFVDGWGFKPSNYCPNCGAKLIA